jgi:rhodanese-related sulfurtransferase
LNKALMMNDKIRVLKLWNHHKRVIVLAVVAIILGITGLGAAQQGNPRFIDVRSLKSLTDKQEKIILVDVRSMLECMDARIPGSLCLPCTEEKTNAAFGGAAKDTPIIFYGSELADPACKVIEEADKSGFTDIRILEGGLLSWRLAGNGVEAVQRIPRFFSRAVKAKEINLWQKEVKNPLIIDIRPPQAYTKNHLNDAVNFPLARLHLYYQDIPLNRSLLVVDEDDTQSFLAVSYLARKGFLNIKRLAGGMASYRRGAK